MRGELSTRSLCGQESARGNNPWRQSCHSLSSNTLLVYDLHPLFVNSAGRIARRSLAPMAPGAPYYPGYKEQRKANDHEPYERGRDAEVYQ
jgi:hypothetical protein